MPRRIEVHKFGGTSVGSAHRIAEAAAIIDRAAKGCSPVVVSSAMSGVTNTLVAIEKHTRAGEKAEALARLDALSQDHLKVRAELVPEAPGLDDEIKALIEEAKDLVTAALLLNELSPRTKDRLHPIGEKLAIRLVAAKLRALGFPAQPVDADTFLDTDDNFGSASPLHGIAERVTAATLKPIIEAGVIPVVTGFCGRAPDGATTTLGRGGSDYSATFLAAALKADEVTIWTDVEGVFTANPKVVPSARPLAQLHYREAAELSFYGAKVLHQRTMIPVAALGIPVRTRNSFAPEAPGTLIDGRMSPGSHPVKALSAIHGHSLLSIEGKGMAGVPGIAARAFYALAKRSLSVTMVSQSSSESSICLAVPVADAVEAERYLKRTFRDELANGTIEEVSLRPHVSLVAVVGMGMARTPGVAARFLDALANRGINVLALAQGSSELNISLAVDEACADEAVRTAHRAFGLTLIDTGVEHPDSFDIILLGPGRVGRALMDLIERQRETIQTRYGLIPKVVGIIDRSAGLLAPAGLSPAQVEEALKAKAARQPLASQPAATPYEELSALLSSLLDYRLVRPVLIDVSDSDDSLELFKIALARGCDVVTANKKPTASAYEGFSTLQRLSHQHGALLRSEATVGAGLPVIDTLQMLLATGDHITQAQGCLSGTLGYITSRLEQGDLLSTIVKDAIELGYTEPDPVADLCGRDVARKALILGRLSGLLDDDVALDLEGLVPEEMAGTPIPALLEHLKGLDASISARVAEAKAQKKTLRYVAQVRRQEVRVGLQAVPLESPLGGLRGTDNMIVFHSARYDQRPLVISGPGAGIDVTAMAVLGDLMRVLAERRSR